MLTSDDWKRADRAPAARAALTAHRTKMREWDTARKARHKADDVALKQLQEDEHRLNADVQRCASAERLAAAEALEELRAVEAAIADQNRLGKELVEARGELRARTSWAADQRKRGADPEAITAAEKRARDQSAAVTALEIRVTAAGKKSELARKAHAQAVKKARETTR